MIAAIALALMFRLEGRPWLTGLALGVGIMIKFYPLVLLPALFRRRDWQLPVMILATAAVGYALYSSAGRLVFGFAGGYVQEEGMNSGSRYFLLELVRRIPGLANLPTPAYLAFSALCFVPLSLWAWRRSEASGAGVMAPAAALAMTMMLLFSPHYPWYLAWLVPFLTLIPAVPLVAYTYGFFYGYTTQWSEPGPKTFLLNEWIYGGTAAALLIGLGVHLYARRQRSTA